LVVLVGSPLDVGTCCVGDIVERKDTELVDGEVVEGAYVDVGVEDAGGNVLGCQGETT
jgi:hypothetical protein